MSVTITEQTGDVRKLCQVLIGLAGLDGRLGGIGAQSRNRPDPPTNRHRPRAASKGNVDIPATEHELLTDVIADVMGQFTERFDGLPIGSGLVNLITCRTIAAFASVVVDVSRQRLGSGLRSKLATSVSASLALSAPESLSLHSGTRDTPAGQVRWQRRDGAKEASALEGHHDNAISRPVVNQLVDGRWKITVDGVVLVTGNDAMVIVEPGRDIEIIRRV